MPGKKKTKNNKLNINIFGKFCGKYDPLLYPIDHDGEKIPLGSYLVKYHEAKSSDTVIIRNVGRVSTIRIVQNKMFKNIKNTKLEISDSVSKVSKNKIK